MFASFAFVLTNEPFFHHYRFIENDPNCADSLDRRIKKYFPEKDALVHTGDYNILFKEVLEEIPDKTPFYPPNKTKNNRVLVLYNKEML